MEQSPLTTSQLDESVGFLMGVTYRKLTNFLLQRLKNYDITPEQWAVLVRVREQEGLIQKELAARSGKDKPTTTRILDTLESKQYITKKPDKSDRRSFLIYMTEKGNTLIEQTLPIERQTLVDVTAGFSKSEYDMLIQLLLRIGENLNQLTKED
ncbi:transcriptional regulator [Paenibacillus baekrokdamisoli]|uniref:Transcriptional regulator n=1 Tax=Paenibacillus baekrokdamisoli TaxID=1712516 RepID=A0A3G9JFS0_9BACL|nr:MarR family transcriptional regulator [Paenibacillus baekrokdamisoli]MBB3072168.1 DNA-binding MarR family transcriptional regulator [Paenibacillus baekrokdamisoli]BBH24751.1 transcriptional regulator [Paenibacillus baekrokdamisoli]